MLKTLFSAFVVSLIFIGCNQSSKTLKTKPNILFIFTDDQTYTALSALGNDEVITPNMDRLVNEGTTFTNAFNMGAWNGAVCAASRAMIISGRSVWEADKYRKHWLTSDSLALENTWPKLMEKAGYDTYMTGKWHVDVPAESIFQNVGHVRPGMPKDSWNHDKMVSLFANEVANGEVSPDEIMPSGYNRPLSRNDTSWRAADTTHGGFWQGGEHWSEVARNDALQFLDKAQLSDDPFFVYLAFNAPHDPRQAPQEFLDLYKIENISLPESWLPEYPFKEDIGNGRDLRDEALAPFPRTEFATKTHIKEYYALITHLDTQIGLVLDRLEANGLKDNTYIFFTSDHGLAMGRHGLIGKQSLFDHSVRPPFVVVGPDIPKNAKVDEEVYLQDVMASALDIAQVEKPEYVAYNSVLPLARGERDQSHYSAIYGAYIDYQRSIRKDKFKLICYPKLDKWLLFDLINDPEEMDDLSDEEEYQGKLKELKVGLYDLQEKFRDPLEL